MIVADMSLLQVRQLILDPAVQKEFERMKAELEKAAKEVKTLQEELQAVQFSQDSKTGRMLMAKCRALQVTLARPFGTAPVPIRELKPSPLPQLEEMSRLARRCEQKMHVI